MTYPDRKYLFILLIIMTTTIASARAAGAQNPVRIEEASILDLNSALASGELSSVEIVRRYLERIEAYDNQGPALNAISSINEQALDIARQLDDERAGNGPRGPLHGIPVIVKDNFETLELPITAGSVLFANWTTGQDAFVVEQLRDAGAIIMATTNMHEYAMGTENFGSLFGQTRNPYEPDHLPGGSSGGTAAAIAANFATVGMGTDTCGSTRTPAAYNNLVSLRGTQGLVSRSGIFPLAPTQDMAGPLARTVSDVAIVFDVIAGSDPNDPQTSASNGNIPENYRKFLQRDGLQDARIGQLNELFGSESEDEEVAEIILRAVADMKGQGATVVDIEIPDLDDHQGGYMSRKEFKFAVNDYLAVQKGAPVDSLQAILDSGEFHPEMEPRLQGAQAAVSLQDKEYLQMLANRDRLSKAILKSMDDKNLDAILYPTMRRKTAPIGESLEGSNCFLSSRSGHPAITVPAGFTDDGLPVGVELIGRKWDETTLLKLAYAYEQATHHRRPPEATPPLTNH